MLSLRQVRNHSQQGGRTQRRKAQQVPGAELPPPLLIRVYAQVLDLPGGAEQAFENGNGVRKRIQAGVLLAGLLAFGKFRVASGGRDAGSDPLIPP